MKIYSQEARLIRIALATTLAGLVCMVTACATISTYDEKAYEKVTACKAEVLNLMNKATTSYDSNKDEIEAVFLDVNKAYQYDKQRPLNRITIAMWDLIRDPKRDTYAGFLVIWKEKSTLHQGFIEEKKIQIGAAFDQISGLESGKIR